MNNFLITTSAYAAAKEFALVEELRQLLELPYVPREKKSLRKVIGDYQGALVVTREQCRLVYADGTSFFFHPDTAILRIKAPRDPLIDLLGKEPLTVLDATMGLASDSLVMSYAGHHVKALESQPLIHLIVARGLQTFDSGNPAINKAMRAIQTQCVDSLEYLKGSPDNSFDAVYFDPMFSENIVEANNLSGLELLANNSRLTEAMLDQAKRVARKKVIIKAHYRDTVFEEMGFERLLRPNQKFHYGLINLLKN